jgi:hypothetical protein
VTLDSGVGAKPGPRWRGLAFVLYWLSVTMYVLSGGPGVTSVSADAFVCGGCGILALGAFARGMYVTGRCELLPVDRLAIQALLPIAVSLLGDAYVVARLARNLPITSTIGYGIGLAWLSVGGLCVWTLTEKWRNKSRLR